MPLAQLYIGSGRSSTEKKKLIEKVTLAMREAMENLRQPVWVVIKEVSLDRWGVDPKSQRVYRESVERVEQRIVGSSTPVLGTIYLSALGQ